MRLRTRCQAYQCTNGGANVLPLPDGMQVAANFTPTLLDRLEYLKRKGGTLTKRDEMFMASILLLRNVGPVQYIANCVGSAITMFFGSKLVLGSIWAYIILLVVLPVSQAGGGEQVHGHGQRNLRQRQVEHTLAFVDNWIQRLQGRNGNNPRPVNPHNSMAKNMAMNMTEQQMLVAAVADSRRER
jgi:hypothetical protein